MLNPSPIELLEGIADALTADVAPALSPGPAADQLTAAVGMLRRIARSLPGLPAYLLEDLAELHNAARTVGASGPPRSEPQPSGQPGSPEGVLEAPIPVGIAALPATLPGLDTLIAWDLHLRDLLADRCATAAQDHGALLELLRSLNRREAALRLSPWER